MMKLAKPKRSTGADDQVGSQDEFEISLSEGIDDESLKGESGARKFSITSYGADYTVDSLVKRMSGDAFTIPSFQRRFVWSQAHASKFIESLLMGLPVPGIFLYKEASTNKHLVIDGQQRLRTLQSFYEGHFGERKFRLTNIREPWLGSTYNDLPISDQLKLDDSVVHATIFTQEQPADVLDSIYFVFERINSGGIRLSPQEIRNCIAAGPFTDLVKELNADEHWRKVFGGPVNKRAKDEELITRFFAMQQWHKKYYRPMSKFLNDFASEMNEKTPKQLDKYRQLFLSSVKTIDKALNGNAFRPVKALNAAVYDAVMVGVANRMAEDDTLTPEALKVAYEELIENEDFRKGWVRATADETNVKARMTAAIAAFEAA